MICKIYCKYINIGPMWKKDSDEGFIIWTMQEHSTSNTFVYDCNIPTKDQELLVFDHSIFMCDKTDAQIAQIAQKRMNYIKYTT